LLFSGKGSVIRWMRDHRYLEMEHLVCIDPDKFKELMPEWPEYVKRESISAGTLTHKESGYIQEIVQVSRAHINFLNKGLI
jgi:hypothetical protein